MATYKIQKRSGAVVDFDKDRIGVAISKAIESIENYELPNENLPQNLTDEINQELEKHFFLESKVPTVEDVQNLVEEKLVEANCFEVAKSFILFRAQRTKLRAHKRIFELETIDQNKTKVFKFDGSQGVYNEAKLRNTWAIAAKGVEDECKFEDLIKVFNITLIDGLKTQDILHNLRKASIDLI